MFRLPALLHRFAADRPAIALHFPRLCLQTHPQPQQPQQHQRRHAHHQRPRAPSKTMAATTTAAAATAAAAAAPDAADDTVVASDGARYRSAQEGLARIYVPLSSSDKAERQNGGGGPAEEGRPQQVFYNPIQQFNRDLSVLAIKAYGSALVARRAAAFARRKEQNADKKRRRQEERAGDEAGAAEGPGGGNAGDESSDAKDKGAERPTKARKRAEGDDVTTDAAAAETAEAETAAAETAEAEAPTPHPASPPPPVRILDALSATGLRALRYAHELPFPVAVTANDLLPAAAEAIRRNVALNGLADAVRVTQGDALVHMYTAVAEDLAALAAAGSSNGSGSGSGNGSGSGSGSGSSAPGGGKRTAKYDVIDLDPYGTAATFFDAAVQAVRNDGGLLCVTCTDAGVWASQGYPEKCFALYGGVPMKGAHSHEAGLRVVLHGLAAAAARYGLAIAPQLSLSIDFYCRVFVTVRRAPARVKFLAARTMVAFNCDHGCGAWTTQPLLRAQAAPNKRGSGVFYKHAFAAGPAAAPFCAHCGAKTHLAGPMYAGPLHAAPFVRRILADLPAAAPAVYGTTDRLRGMLQTALEEVAEAEAEAEAEAKEPADADPEADPDYMAIDPMPFFFVPTHLAKALHCTTPGEDAVRGALLRLGYRVTRSHCKPGSIKTDAPWAVLWDVMRAWVRQKAPVKTDNIRPGTTAYRLLRLGEAGKAADGNDADTTTGASGTPAAIVFDERLGRLHGRSSDGTKLVRYQANPRENWGPMNRAKGH